MNDDISDTEKNGVTYGGDDKLNKGGSNKKVEDNASDPQSEKDDFEDAHIISR